MNTQQTACPKLYIGIDIHKRSWKVHCATDLFAGKSFSMSPDPKQLQTYVSKHFRDYEVTTAYEAGCCGYYAHRCFEDYGWRSPVAHTAGGRVVAGLNPVIPVEVNDNQRVLFVSDIS